MAYQRVYPVDDEAGRKARAKKKTHCMFCGVPRDRAPRLYGGVPCSTHHIIRSGRSDEPCNEAFICGRCHDLVHDGNIRGDDGELLPRLTLGIVLTLKKTREPESWDPDRLQALFGQTLPDLLPIPDFLEAEYRRNRPEPFRPWADWVEPAIDPTAVVLAAIKREKPASYAKQVEKMIDAPISVDAPATKKVMVKIPANICARCFRLKNFNPRRTCPACKRLGSIK